MKDYTYPEDEVYFRTLVVSLSYKNTKLKARPVPS